MASVEAEIIKLGETGSYMLWPIPLPKIIHAEDIYTSDERLFTNLPDDTGFTTYIHDPVMQTFTRDDTET